MARQGFGYAQWVGDGAGGSTSLDVERHTFTCCHCNTVVIVGDRRSDVAEAGGYCTMCDDHTCKACATKGGCEPFERQLEAMERRGRLLTAIGGG